MNTDKTLEQISKAEKMLKQAVKTAELAPVKGVKDLKDIQSQAETVRQYAKRIGKGLKVQNQVARIKIESEYAIGKVLKKLEFNRGSAKKGWKTRFHDGTTLQSLGLEKKQSHRWQIMSSLPEQELWEYFDDTCEKNKEITSAAVINIAKKLKRKEDLDRVEADLPVIKGKFDVIAVDPPWPYASKYDPEGRRVACPYPDMDIEEIKAIEIPAANDCVLWLWTTNAFMYEAYEIAEAWGFTVKTILTWAKNKMGLGDWLRGKTEHSLLCVKGKPKIRLTNQTTLLEAPARQHSRKPDEFYKMVDDLCIGRKLDYFSREKREGWAQFGNEEDKFK